VVLASSFLCGGILTGFSALSVGQRPERSYILTEWPQHAQRSRVANLQSWTSESRSVRRSAAHRRCDVRAAEKRSVARSRKGLSNFRSTLPYKPSVSWWTAHGILTRHFASRGFSFPSLLALRVLSEGVHPALSTVLVGRQSSRVRFARGNLSPTGLTTAAPVWYPAGVMWTIGIVADNTRKGNTKGVFWALRPSPVWGEKPALYLLDPHLTRWGRVY
jgi:hypothetical protein